MEKKNGLTRSDYERNRSRRNRHTIRLTDEEEKIIQERMKETGMNFSQYIIHAAIGEGTIVINNFDAIKDLSYEMKKIGTNINQIAKKANEINFVRDQDISDLKNEMNKMWMAINNIFKQVKRKK